VPELLNMTLQKWIEDRAIHGFPTFSVEDVRAADLCSSDKLYEQLRTSSGYFKYQPLSTSAEDNPSNRDSRWKININVEIETDDI